MLIPSNICDQLSDEEMVSRALGDMDYFNCIVLRYGDRLARYIKRISGADEQEVEDVLQDSFIKVWKNLNEYRVELKLSSWLYRIVHNVTVSKWRKKKTMRHVLTENVEDITKVIYEDSSSIEESEINIIQSLYQLKPRYKDVLVLKYFEGMNYEEISDVLKIPEGTVAVRLNRARKQMKELLNNKA